MRRWKSIVTGLGSLAALHAASALAQNYPPAPYFGSPPLSAIPAASRAPRPLADNRGHQPLLASRTVGSSAGANTAEARRYFTAFQDNGQAAGEPQSNGELSVDSVPQNGGYHSAPATGRYLGGTYGANGCGSASCGTCGTGGGTCRQEPFDNWSSFGLPDTSSGCWYGSVAGLAMTRDRGNKLWTTFETGNNPNQLVFTPDSDWAGGVEFRVGRYICCGQYSMEAVYWILDEMEGAIDFNAAANGLVSVGTPLNVSLPDVEFLSDGTDLDAIFDGAAEHRLRRASDFQNLEINLLGHNYTGCRFQGSWLAGFHFLRFREGLVFGSVAGGFTFGQDLAEEAYINADVENNLIGFHIGGRGEYNATGRLSVYAAPSVGIYGNHISQNSAIYRGTGELATNVDSGATMLFDSSKDDFAMIGQIDVGLAYQLANWRIFGGYRAMALSGVALADNQIPFYVGAEDEWLDIDSNGHVILHGTYAGAECRF